MKDGVLARLPIVVVTAQQAALPGRPGVCDGHADAPQEMPDLRDHCDGVLERVVVAVNVQVDFVVVGKREPLGKRLLKQVKALLAVSQSL